MSTSATASTQKHVKAQDAIKRNRSDLSRVAVAQKEFVAGASVGISSEDTFLSLSNNSRPNILNTSQEHRSIKDKWQLMSELILKNGVSSNIRRLMDRIPKAVEDMFDRLEKDFSKSEEKLDEESRIVLYKEFSKMSSTSLGELHGWEVEILAHSDPVRKALKVQHLELSVLSAMIKDAVSRTAKTSHKDVVNNQPASADERHSAYDLERFAMVAYDIRHQAQRPRPVETEPPRWHLRRYLPIDPDSAAKQYWDMFIMVLLVYCSFEVRRP